MRTSPLGERLPTAPKAVLTAEGVPAFGTYAGALAQVDWQGLAPGYRRPPLWTLLHHKRWYYAAINAPDCLVALVIVDVGWTTTGFAYLYDRAARRIAGGCSAMGLPGLSALVRPRPGEGAHAFFRGLGCTLRIERPMGSATYRVTARSPQLRLDAELSAGEAPPGLLAIVPIADGVANCTHKTSGLPARGTAVAGGRRYELAGGTGSLDHTDGLLARDTAWQWASGHGAGIGFNLQAGFNGDNENALWLHGQLIRLGAARFDYDARNPLAPWRITTDDGLLELTFTPGALRREDKDLGFAVSRYVQPVGTFTGTVRATADGPAVGVADLLGVTEDHTSRW